MRQYYFLIVAFFFLASVNAQDTIMRKPYVDSLPTSFFLAPSIGIANISNTNFIYKLYQETPSLQPKDPKGDPSPYWFDSKDVLTSFGVFGGADLTSQRFSWLHHVIEIGYQRFAGDFAYRYHYSYQTIIQGSITYNDVSDDVGANYICETFSLGYKLQAASKHFFASVGVNLYMSEVTIVEKTDEGKSVWTPGYGGTWSQNTIDKRSGCHLLYYPLQLGGGSIMRTSKLIIKPGVYWTPCFLDGPFYYSFSISVGLRRYRLESY